MGQVLRQRNFFLLWLAQLISRSGDWLLLIALPFFVYGLTNSAFSMGTTFILQMAPRVLLGSLLGVFVDRWNQKWVMIGADLARALLLLPLLLVQSADNIWLVYLVALLQATLSQWYSPASSTLLPCLVDAEELLAANAASAFARNLTQMVAPSLGGALFELLGMRSVVLLDSASFLLSALLTFLIVVPAMPRTRPLLPAERGSGAWMRLWRDWQAGIVLVMESRAITTIFLALAISMFAQGLIDVLFVLYVKKILQGSTFHWGLIESAQGIGGLVGGLMIERLSKTRGHAQLLALGLAGTGLFFLASISVPILPLVIFFTGLIGIPVVILSVSVETGLQRHSDERCLGRVFGSYGSMATSMLMAGMAVAALVGDTLDVTLLLHVAGVLYVLAALIVVLREGRSAREVPV
jgi:MFS family permease